MEKVCFLFGHHNAPMTLVPELEAAVRRHYLAYGVRNFLVGSRGDFDRMAATAVKRIKREYPDICLLLLLAYHPAERPVQTPPGFDSTYYPLMGNVPQRVAICRANRAAAATADHIICYVCHSGNTRELLVYAQKKTSNIENLASI